VDDFSISMAVKLSVVVASLILVCVVAMLLLPLAIHHDPNEHLIKLKAETSSLGQNGGMTPTSVAGDTDDKKIYLKSLADKTGFKAAPDGGLSSGQSTSNIGTNDDGAPVDISALDPASVAIIQFDSRKLVLTGGSGESNYWTASALWNKYYCALHRHKFLYYTLEGGSGQCKSHTGEMLADPWCKVKAMVEADKQHVDIKLFVYMDSDAVLDRNFVNRPLQELLGVMQTKLGWKPHEKPTVFNQDGPCWWCDLVESKGYSMCLNAGTVVWYRHPRSRATLTAWWESAMDPYAHNPIKRAFRTKWPWEQDRQMALYVYGIILFLFFLLFLLMVVSLPLCPFVSLVYLSIAACLHSLTRHV
jgi:hypothetical protein